MLPKDAFTVDRLVRFSDCDPGGIVYFPRYFDLMNALVEDWFNQRLGLDYAERLLTGRQGLPTVHAECDFMRPSLMGETITWGLTVDRIGTSSITVDIVAARGEEERLNATLVLVATSLETHRPIPISDDLRQAVEAYQAECR
jgi:4-hydroxybenzoyl-CoA thioesterase